MARENLAAAAQRVDEVTKNLIQRSQEIQAKEKNKNDKDIINLDNGMFELPGRKIKNGANFQNSERGLVEWVRDYLPEDIIITAGGDRENEHASGRRNIDLRSRDNKFWA
ncbi:MAG: hypothetical protein LBE56_12780 [Tannerella sp.]|jgi:hypothetical protein|nr:hypothetical protein [Tannerella sp.]